MTANLLLNGITSSCFGVDEDGLATLPDYLVALACLGLQSTPIRDLDFAAAVADEAGLLKVARDDCQCGSTHSEHLGKELLRERQHVTVASISRLQKPSTQSGL